MPIEKKDSYILAQYNGENQNGEATLSVGRDGISGVIAADGNHTH
jgi:hypothetical protein